jgi:hypothetical protein
MRILARVPTVAVVLVLAACLQQALVATGVIPMGSVSGAAPPFSFLGLVALLALLFTGGLLVAWSFQRADEWHLAGSPGVVLLAAAGALLVLTRYYSYDPYYLPTLRRISDGENQARLLVVAALGGSRGRVPLARAD